MELLDLKISRRPELVSGIKISEGSQWIEIKNNPVDFVLDGYSFINKRFIKNKFEVSEDDFDYKVLYIKNKEEHFSVPKVSLETYEDVLTYFFETNKLIEIELESSNYCIIGRVLKINEKSFVINKLSVEGIFLSEDNIKYDSVRIINCETDYIISMEKYLIHK